MHYQRVQKLITFSPQLYKFMEKKAKKIGVSFPEYIRVLAVNDIKDMIDENLPMVSENEEKQIMQSLQDIKRGRYTIINNNKELETHLKSL